MVFCIFPFAKLVNVTDEDQIKLGKM